MITRTRARERMHARTYIHTCMQAYAHSIDWSFFSKWP